MTYSLAIAEHHWQAWLAHVLADREERMAFGFCGATTTADEVQYLVRTVDLARDYEYRFRGCAGVSLKAEHVVARVARAKGHAAFIDVHSHPFTSQPVPSGTDDLGAERQVRVLRDLAPGTALIRLVFGASGSVWAEVTLPGVVRWSPLERIVVLGREARHEIRPLNSAQRNKCRVHDARDLRTAAVVGEDAASIVHAIRVAVIGGGGVGSAVLAQIRGYVHDISVIDPDVVEIQNAPRLYHYADGDRGRMKVEVHAREIRRAFPDSYVRAICAHFPDDDTLDAFKRADVVFCCPDHNAVRYAAAQLGARFLKPVFEVGCGGRAETGRVTALGYHVRLQVPGAACLACNGLDLREVEDPASSEMKRRAGYVTVGDLIAGELMPLTTRAAADAVDLFFRYVTGYARPVPRHLYFDALGFQTIDATAAFQPQPLCTLCGEGSEAFIGAGDSLGPDQQVLPPSGGLIHAAQ